mmetsp:Transcript_34548/g.35215  ORF Transcript_34548/g.35215 Transcript_34548/m.35215 type:complete len:85 (+) Transcript_34548:53-307(+)
MVKLNTIIQCFNRLVSPIHLMMQSFSHQKARVIRHHSRHFTRGKVKRDMVNQMVKWLRSLRMSGQNSRDMSRTSTLSTDLSPMI